MRKDTKNSYFFIVIVLVLAIFLAYYHYSFILLLVVILMLCLGMMQCSKITRLANLSDGRFQLVLDSSSEGVYALDTHLRCVFVNQAAKDLLGYHEENLIGLKLLDLIIRDEGTGLGGGHALVEETIRSGTEQKIENAKFYKKDGSVITVKCHTRPIIEDEKRVGAVVVFQDITDQQATIQQLKRNEEIFSIVEQVLGVGVWEWDIEKNSFTMSNRQHEILGFKNDSLTVSGREILTLVHEEDRIPLRKQLDLAIDGNPIFGIECRVQREQGWATIKFFGRVTFNQEGRGIHIAGLSWDLTSQKIVESELVQCRDYQRKLEKLLDDQAKELQVKTAIERSEEQTTKLAEGAKTLRFLTGMNHDLRTPLNSILGFAQLLEQRKAGSTEQRSGSQILKSGRHLLRLISEIVDFAKIESGELQLNIQPTPVVSFLQEVVDVVSTRVEERGVTLVTNFEIGKGQWISTDRDKFHQVISNLVFHVVRNCKLAGEVKLSVVEVASSTVTLAISDPGSVIPLDRVTPLFNEESDGESAQGKMHEMELNLCFAKKLVEEMRGKVLLETGIHEGGNRFTVTVPTCASAQHDTHSLQNSTIDKTKVKVASTANDNDVKKQYRLLNVEDNPANRQLVKSILKKNKNYTLLEAGTGESGVEMAIKHRPNCILMDINLPDMSGFEALVKLKDNSETKSIPVIAVSGKVSMEDIEAGLEAGFVKYIEKPLNVAEFRRIIREVLNQT